MKDTANILSFDDARSSHSRVPLSASRTSSRPSSRRFRARRDIDPAQAEADAWEEARSAARRAKHGFGGTETRASRRSAFLKTENASRREEGRHAAEASGADGEAPEREGLVASLSNRAREWKRTRAKARADKAFDRQFEQRVSDAAQAGPRAALYKGEMGSSQKRASRMQQGGADASGGARAKFSLSGIGGLSGIAEAIASSRKAMAAIVVVGCLALTCVFLYEPAQHYYHAVREQDRLQAELAAVQARNAELEDAVAYIQTDSGIEQSARDELGWVRSGEYSVYVQGLEGVSGSATETASTAGSIVPGSIEAPTTWYSPVLDAIFGAE